jgi:dihydropteroate synthase
MLWRLREHSFDIGRRALVMGIVNVTPDSFSDGGQFLSNKAAIAHGLELVRQGADLLDIGGESTRPGAQPVSVEEELKRVLPIVRELTRAVKVPISIDTYKAQVARGCLEAGAQVINDVTACGDPHMMEAVRSFGAGLILMHMQGTPATMQLNPHYQDVVREVYEFLRERMEAAIAGGVATEAIALDPGIGFGKTNEHSLELLRRLEGFQRLDRPICLGVSRKGFIGTITGRPRHERAIGSVAVACHALARGAAQIIRVHDVAETRDAVLMCEALAG